MAAYMGLMLLLVLPQALATRKEDKPAHKEEHDGAVLLQADVTKTDGKGKIRGPNPANWFGGGFSEGESTYDTDGLLAGRNVNTQINVLDGWNPHQPNPLYDKAVDPNWFQESISGGSHEPWQTNYPVMEGSIAGNRASTGLWFTGAGGVTQQEYKHSEDHRNDVFDDAKDKSLPASWFDNSVRQLDGFGRRKYPGLASERHDYQWEERSSNTTLECQKPGCIANISLVAPYDTKTEIAKDCKLHVFFRPTDFDNWYKGENVEWVKVNDQLVDTHCHTYRSGCNATAQRPLLPCVTDLPLNHLLETGSNLFVQAKIPEYVDECPYNGNMLSAVPMVTCLVAPIAGIKNTLPSLLNTDACVFKRPLQCKDKGCTSKVAIPISAGCQQRGPCTLKLDVLQTDYDNGDGTDEFVEFLKVDGVEAGANINPGQNPCKSEWSGNKLNPDQMGFTALEGYPVRVNNNVVMVEGKITQFVDECASNGNLFDAIATVTCGAGAAPAAPAAASLLQKSKKKATAPHRQQLRGTK